MDEERLENEGMNREQEEAGFPSAAEEGQAELQSPALPKGAGLLARLKDLFKTGTASQPGDGLLPPRESESAEETGSAEDQSAEPYDEPMEISSVSPSESMPEAHEIADQSAEPAGEPLQDADPSAAESEPGLGPKVT
ncbi:MAG: hypothetical protein Q8O74_07375 [bacterium]|nr:hypothetical protein [bacterium]